MKPMIVESMVSYQPFTTVLGQTIQCAHILQDPETNQTGMFFIFPDLSIRIAGLYRFRCELVHVET